MRNQTLKDQVIVINGAGSGLGRSAALRLAGQGACLVLAARRARLLRDLALECEVVGGWALAIPTDTRERAEVQILASRTMQEFGRVDAWINCEPRELPHGREIAARLLGEQGGGVLVCIDESGGAGVFVEVEMPGQMAARRYTDLEAINMVVRVASESDAGSASSARQSAKH